MLRFAWVAAALLAFGCGSRREVEIGGKRYLSYGAPYSDALSPQYLTAPVDSRQQILARGENERMAEPCRSTEFDRDPARRVAVAREEAPSEDTVDVLRGGSTGSAGYPSGSLPDCPRHKE